MSRILLSFLFLVLALGGISSAVAPAAAAATGEAAADLLAVSDDGSYAATVEKSRLRLFSAGRDAPLWSRDLLDQRVAALGISPQGALIYLDLGDGALLYEGKTGTLLRSYPNMRTHFQAFSDGGKTLLAVYAGFDNGTEPQTYSLAVYDPAEGRLLKKVEGVMRSCYLQPRGTFLAYRIQYQNTTIVNLESGREYSLEGDAAVGAISNSGKLALVSDKLLYDRLIRIENGEQVGKEQRLPKYRQAIFSQDDKFVLLDCGRDLLVMDTENFEFAAQLPAAGPRAKFRGADELSSLVPRYPWELLDCFTAEYQYALDKDFNNLQNLQARDKTREQFAFLEKYPAAPINKYYPARLEVIEEVADNLFRSRLAAGDTQNLLKFVKAGYSNEEQSQSALKQVIRAYAQSPNINKFVEILELKAAGSAVRRSAVAQIHALVEKQNNLCGYLWYLEKYPLSPEAPAVLQKLYNRLLAETRRINTISAYNDFVIACPYSDFLDIAEKEGLDLDREESEPGLFSNRDQRARDLAARITAVCNKGRAADNDFYSLVAARMVKMQQELFGSRPATAKLLQEPVIVEALEKERGCRAKIAGANAEARRSRAQKAAQLREQARLIRRHLENGPLDEELQARYQADCRAWQAYLTQQ